MLPQAHTTETGEGACVFQPVLHAAAASRVGGLLPPTQEPDSHHSIPPNPTLTPPPFTTTSPPHHLTPPSSTGQPQRRLQRRDASCRQVLRAATLADAKSRRCCRHTTSVQFTLANLVLDRTQQRAGVSILSPTGIVSYTQTNVDILNGYWKFGGGYNCMGLAISGNVMAKITGGLFMGNLAADNGAAIYYNAATNSKVGSLTISGVNFTANTLNGKNAEGGALYVRGDTAGLGGE
jgi:hypothetical protein